MPIDFGNIQGNIVDSTGQGPGAPAQPTSNIQTVTTGPISPQTDLGVKTEMSQSEKIRQDNAEAEAYRQQMLRLINKGTDEQQVNLLTSMDSDIARRGISNEDFAAFNRDLYDANPAAMEAARPFSSGAFVRGLANFSPMNLGRNLLTDFFSKFGKQSGSIVDDTPADEIGLDLAQTMQMAERDPNKMGVMALDTTPREGELMGEFINRKFNEDPIIQKYFGNKEKEERLDEILEELGITNNSNKGMNPYFDLFKQYDLETQRNIFNNLPSIMP